MTTAAPCRCRATRTTTRDTPPILLVDALAKATGQPRGMLAELPCADVHALLRVAVSSEHLAAAERALAVEAVSPVGPSYTRRSMVLAVFLLVATVVGFCGALTIIGKAAL